jgi:hypothetical protein
MSFSFHVESHFVWGSSWIGGDFWWLRVQVSWRRHSPELAAVLVQQETGRSFEPPGDNSRIVGDPDIIQMGIVQISIGKSACGE